MHQEAVGLLRKKWTHDLVPDGILVDRERRTVVA